MIEPDYTDFTVNISEIWRLHRLFYYEEPEERKARFLLKLRKKLIQKIVSTEKPFYSSHQNKEVFDKIKEEENEYSTFPHILKLNEFTHGFDAYQFFEKRLVSSEDLDFNYWFALKLETFKDEIRAIEYFLDYHLIKNFETNLEVYLNFLDLMIDQFQDVFLSRRVVSRVNKYYDALEDEIAYEDVEENERRNTTEQHKEKPKTKQHSLYLNKTFRKKDGTFPATTRSIFFNLREALIEKKFIDKKASIVQLTSMFDNKKIAFSDRVIWNCHKVSLRIFLEFFKNNKLTVHLGNDFWRTAVGCFKTKSKVSIDSTDQYEELDPRRVSTAKDGKAKRKEELHEILELFVQGDLKK